MKTPENLSFVEAPVLQPSWTNAPDQKVLAEDLNAALSDHTAMIARVSEWRKELENRPVSRETSSSNRDKGVKTRSTYTAKLIRKQCEWRYPSISEPFLSTPDLFKVSPMTHLDVLAARQNELVLNQQFNTSIARVHFFDTYVRTLVNNGTVIVKTTWKERKGKTLQEVNEVEFIEAQNKQQEQEIATWIQLFQDDPDRFEQLVTPEWDEAINMTMQNNVPIYPVITGKKKELVEAVTANHPELTVCNYKNVIIDPTCKGKVQDAKFIIHMFETCLGDLKADGRYKNLDYINTNEASPLASPNNYEASTVAFKFADEARKKIVAYEYWGYRDIDGSGRLTPIVATWVGNTLIQLEYSPYPEGYLPFVVVAYMPTEESVYGEADAELLKDNQAVVGAIQRGMIDSMGRSANAQIGYRKDALDAVNSRRLKAGEDFEFNPNVDPTLAFHQMKYPEIPQSAMLMVEMNTAEAEALTGVKSFTGGISGNSVGNTATGVRSAMDATAKRDSDILRRAGEGVVQIGRQMMMMNSLFLDEAEVVRITDDDYVPIKKEDLQGKFDLRLTISTAETDNQKAEELSFMFQTVGNTMGLGMGKLLLAEIARLRKMPELARKIENFEEKPDPLAVKKAELEIALLEAQIQDTLSSAAKKTADANIAPVVAQTELARQRKFNTEADLNDLDYIEQETGTKQERELQKAQAQAAGNIELEFAKAKLNKGE